MQCNPSLDLCLTDSDLRDGGRDGPNYMVVKGICFCLIPSPFMAATECLGALVENS
jgi:hypothetical protein